MAIIVQQFLCFDVGGTYIKYGFFDQIGKQLEATAKVPTIIKGDQNQILDQLISITQDVVGQTKIAGIAVATAGVVDRNGSIRYSGYTIPGYTGTPIKEKMEATFKLPCVVINDVNAACYGEYWKGFQNNRKPKSLFCLTIGTGVGGAFVLDGELYTGASDMAGEIGYLPMTNGLFQDIASTTALLREAEKVEGKTLSGEAFFKEIEKTNQGPYEKVLQSFIDALAIGILTITYMMNPEYIVLGGGILAQADILLPKLDAALRQQVIDERFLTAKIIPATLGNNAGMLGALYHLLQKVNRSYLCE